MNDVRDGIRNRLPLPRLPLLALFLLPALAAGEDAGFEDLAREYGERVRPLLESFCLDCHSSEEKKGELDLERFAALADVRRHPETWQKVAEMLDAGEMPPKARPQLAPAEREQLRGWVGRYLDAEARARAGDPGRVALRRLNNAEYTYTIQDLTGAALDPAREFPADGAAGEGFTNAGDALAMSPALLEKYLDAAKEIASHAVLLPDGIRFSTGTTRRDWTDEILREIRAIYGRHADPANGRLDPLPYLAALIRHRERLLADVGAADAAAREEGMNPRYLGMLAGMLVSGEPPSLLLDRVRALWRAARPGDAPALAAEIRAWQEKLWKTNPVGHFGMVRPWQEPAPAAARSRDLRLPASAARGEGEDAVFYLVAGSAGDGGASDFVIWERPRFERPGRPPVLLRDLRAISIALAGIRRQAAGSIARCLAAAREVIRDPEARDLAALARDRGVDPILLGAWLDYLGVSRDGAARIDEYLHGKVERGGGYDFVKGWMLPGVGDLSLVSNASDNAVNIPGRMNPHRVAVHPRPERWVAAGWRSPAAGRFRLAPLVEDRHPDCGNGVSWSLELWQGPRRRALAAGEFDRGGAARIAPLEGVSLEAGDLVALVIGPRAGDHTCDLTEIDIAIAEEGGERRSWSLSGDCADDIHAGNPHPDRLGNDAVWHFFTGRIDGRDRAGEIPRGSLLERWLEAAEAGEAARLAGEIEELVAAPPAPGTPAPDAELRAQLAAPGGPLLSRIDVAALAAAAPAGAIAEGRHGLDPDLFGRNPDGSAADPAHLVVRAPSVIEVRAPRGLIEGAEFAVAGRLHGAAGPEGSVQLEISAARPEDAAALIPGAPILVEEGGEAERRAVRSVEAFNRFFPPALCYPQIVPVDEVVTLVLFHREDEPLRRLMLDDAEARRLDRLWEELRYVSRDALTIVTAYEQLMEFATQDDDPRKYAPLRQPIQERAAAFRRFLLETEPRHLESLLELAALAYRRPLEEREAHGLLALYHALRADDIEHDEAVRLTLARILAAPAFLYRIEKSPPGAEPGPVSGWELATRLSYFLWSTLPDAELRAEAASGRLVDPDALSAQARRMLRDPRVRRLAVEFACQWLHIRGFDELDEKSERRFPSFAGLRGAMYEEAILFFADLFQRDGSVLEILDADHAFLDGPLAAHYGIPGVDGSGWRRVGGVKEFARGGILGLAAALSRHSGASRTSPVLRGVWISETLIGEKVPRPPKDVPQLPETAPEGLTERQLVERHAADPACAKCHRRIDPYGFALEGFDAIGRRRERDDGGLPIDARAALPTGEEVEGIDGLRRYLLTVRRDAFLKQFCRKLLGFALGRAVQLSDEPLLAEMLQNLRDEGWNFGAAVETIVRSRQFREIRGREAAGGGDG